MVFAVGVCLLLRLVWNCVFRLFSSVGFPVRSTALWFFILFYDKFVEEPSAGGVVVEVHE